MSHPNPSGNGCSLEDCLTNLFALLCSTTGEKLKDKPEDYRVWMAQHEPACTINHVGSSGAMEVQAAKRLWQRSLRHNLRYTTLISDGDCNTFKELQTTQPYGASHPIVKEECINHFSKRVGTALRKVVTTEKARGVTLGGAKQGSLTQTDLCGIKWRKLISENNYIEPLEDPVLVGFSRCISNDILCVWRRAQLDNEQRQTDFNCNKELWIFWYGNEPENLRQALSPDLGLKEAESGTWDRDRENQNGLPYECRTLLFKALHNLIERNLLLKNFVRLGRWYVQPYNQGCEGPGIHLSFSFHYFLHGESQVCASIEVKLRPSIWRLTNHHISQVQNNQASIQVILAPYGLSGMLTGVTYPDNESTSPVSKMFEEWAGYFPLQDQNNSQAGVPDGAGTNRDKSGSNLYNGTGRLSSVVSGGKVPNMVEVIVGGTRMAYPSSYVMVVENEDLWSSNLSNQHSTDHSQFLHNPLHTGGGGRHLSGRSTSQISPPPSPMDSSTIVPGQTDQQVCQGQFQQQQAKLFGPPPSSQPSSASTIPDAIPFISSTRAEVIGYTLAEKVRQDACHSISPNKRSPDVSNNGDDQSSNQYSLLGTWNFTDPAGKVNCNCVRHRKRLQGKHSKSDRIDNRRNSRNTVPFHRRGAQAEDVLHIDRLMAQLPGQQLTTSSFCMSSGSSSVCNPLITSTSSTPVIAADVPTGMDTLNSAPSPLDEPSSQQLATNSSVMDPTMPTLSPHPPGKVGLEANCVKTSNGCGSGTPAAGAVASSVPESSQSSQTVPISSSLNMTASVPVTSSSTSVSPINGAGTNSSCSMFLTNSQSNGQSNVNSMSTLQVATGPAEVFIKSEDFSNVCNKTMETANQFSWQSVTSKTESISHWVNSHVAAMDRHQNQPSDTNLKRPSLPTKSTDNDLEQVCDSLYDFEPLNSWINLPLKKGRFESLGDGSVSDIILASTSCPSRSLAMMNSPSPPHPDPYDFSEEASMDPKTLTTRSRPSRDDLISRHSPLGKIEEDCRPSSRQGNVDINIKEEIANGGSPATPGGSLTRETDLRFMGTDKDLEQLFQSESSSENDDDDRGTLESVLGVKSADELRPSKIPNGTLGIIPPLDRMYPTPPSHDTNKSHSPETMTDVTAEGILTAGSFTSFPSTVEGSAPPILESISNVKCDVFLPCTMAETVGAVKYCTVDMPSGHMSPLPQLPDYKPSWSFVMQHGQRGHYVNLPSVENISSIRTQGSGIDASPAIPYSNSQQRTPLSYELTSPASNSSSYLNKTNFSIDNHGTNSQLPEANSLLLNVLLSDSILNVYKDHNFDSCTICVCNAERKCSCAFSAAINRRYGFDSGLFYEDEVEITNYRHDRYDHPKPPLTLQILHKGSNGDGPNKTEDDLTPTVLNHLLGQYGSPFLSCVGTQHMEMLKMTSDMCYQSTSVDVLQIRDANDEVSQALEVARLAMDNCLTSRFDELLLHRWPFLRGPRCIPCNSQDIIWCLKSLHPILQEAVQNKRVTRSWENTYKLQGPISWKDFHDLAGRGSEENHEPQPIPQVLVGHDKDWLSVSPYSIRYWDKQFLEPYGRMRDMLYVVVAPDNDFILQHVVAFFKELSTVYETCRLGRHCAINKPLRDGVLRVGKQAATKLADEPVDDWFNTLGDSLVAGKLKLYAQVCKHNLGPVLCQPNLDKSMFEQASAGTRSGQFKMPEPAVLGSQGGFGSSGTSCARPTTPDSQMSLSPAAMSQGGQQDEQKDSSGESSGAVPDTGNIDGPGSEDLNPDAPGIVVYLVDPFSYGHQASDHNSAISRLAIIGLLRCYQQMALPDHLASNVSLQLVPLHTILEHKDSASKLQTLKSIAFSVFTACKWNLSHAIAGRPLTGFGPAAAAEQFLKRKEGDLTKLYSPPFILASTKSRQNQIMEGKCEQQTIIFCGYCLSEDQRWLLAVCTDERGELMEYTTINIEIPNRNRRKKASARRPGLQKLWDFILGIVSLTCYPTRLVIGRFGRMGHGELKGWSGLLNKKNLQASAKRLRDMCNQCSVMGPSEVPCVLSVCLVSMETHPSFQVIVDALKQEEKQSSSIPLQTPRDASVTHILVFPTSATAQVNSNPLQQDPQNDFGASLLDDVLDFNTIGEDMQLFDTIFGDSGIDAPAVSPPGSPTNTTNRHNSCTNGPSISLAEPLLDPQDSFNLLQQPLAMGYYISTAPPGPMPKWFWSACPENEFTSPHVFKSALHIHESPRQDIEFLHKSDNKSKPHALDSHMTCDVLRYVLENYNSLSWLTFDPVLNDRRSCLPVHFLVLMQLYHALNTFV